MLTRAMFFELLTTRSLLPNMLPDMAAEHIVCALPLGDIAHMYQSLLPEEREHVRKKVIEHKSLRTVELRDISGGVGLLLMAKECGIHVGVNEHMVRVAVNSEMAANLIDIILDGITCYGTVSVNRRKLVEAAIRESSPVAIAALTLSHGLNLEEITSSMTE